MHIRLSALVSTILAGSMLAIAPATPAYAQETQAGAPRDLLIMRRKISEPKTFTSPGTSGGERVTTGLKDIGPGANAYRPVGEVNLAVSALGCLKDGALVAEANCSTGATGAQLGQLVAFPARMDPDLKAVHVTRDAFTTALPHAPAAVIDSLCESRIGIGAENWRLSCDPQSIVNQYRKYVSRLSDPGGFGTRFQPSPNSSATANFINLVVTDYGCRSTVTGSELAKSTCDALKREPNLYDIVSLPAELNPEFRRAYVTRDSIRSVLPDMSTARIDAICTMGVKVQDQDWKVVCGTPQSPENFMRVASFVVDPYRAHGSLGVDFQKRNKIGATSFDFYVGSTLCIDTSTGTSTSNTNCQFLTSGANTYDIVTVGATQVHGLREIYFDEQALRDAAPYASSFDYNSITALCSGQATLGVHNEAGNRISYTALCGTPDDPVNYERVPLSLRDPQYKSYTGSLPRRNTSSRSMIELVVESTRCWNLATNSIADNRKCTALPTGAALYDIASLPAVFVPELREFYVDEAQAGALIPRGGSFGINNTGNHSLSQFCSGGLTFYIEENGLSTSYAPACGTPDDPAKYDRIVWRVRDAWYVDYPGADKKRNKSTRSDFDFIVTHTQCWDKTVGGIISNSRKCNFLGRGVSEDDVKTFPVTYVRQLREMYFDRAAAAAVMAPASNVTYGSSTTQNSSLDQLCAGVTLYTEQAGTMVAYTTGCGTPDDPANYERYATYHADPYTNYDANSDRYRNKATRSEIDFTVYSTGCRDTRTNANATASKCTYLDNGPSRYDVRTLPATYNTATKEVFVSKANLQSLVKYSGGLYFAGNRSIDQVCTGSYTMAINTTGTSTTAYRLKCSS